MSDAVVESRPTFDEDQTLLFSQADYENQVLVRQPVTDSEAFDSTPDYATVNNSSTVIETENDMLLEESLEVSAIDEFHHEVPGAIHDIVSGLGLKVDFTKIPNKLEFKKLI